MFACTLLLAEPHDLAAQEQSTPTPTVADQRESDRLHADWDRLLATHVRAERVDYLRLRADDRDRLQGYLDRMAEVDVAELGRSAQLAYYLNLYNATMVAAVVERYRPGWTPEQDRFAVFQDRLVRLRNGRVSLDHLEHQIIRPGFRDHRVHVALVCGARSCPPLLQRAYTADDLDEVLQQKWRAFLDDSFRNRVDHKARTVHLSRLFEWYSGDFGGEAGIRRLLTAHFGKEIGAYRIAWLDYSWALNIVPAADR